MSGEYVDLGLSVKWATMNIGAERVIDHGGYFAWGESGTYQRGLSGKSCATVAIASGNGPA